MSLLPQLKQRVVRDLYWACFSQPLMDTDCNVVCYQHVLEHFPHLEKWFLDLDQEPNDLSEHLAQLHSSRLGVYFEALWEYYLRYASVADLLAKNLQVREGKQTLGEYDFIYYCRRRRCHIHLETAVKFYLGVPGYCGGNMADLAQTTAWVGPGCRDRLDIKYQALVKHQLVLSQTEAGRGSLLRLGVEAISSELALKGILFYPYPAIQSPSPIGHCHQHQRGLWLSHGQLVQQSLKNAMWQILERRQWCSPTLLSNDADLMATDTLIAQLKDYFSCESHPPLQIVNLRQCADSWLESERYFIVPNGWNGRPGS